MDGREGMDQPLLDDMIFCPGGSLIAAVSGGYEDTLRIGRLFAEILEDGDVVGMDGDLGAGKTALASGIASGLGVRASVPSPTFTILHEYDAGGQATGGIRRLFHFDVYRLVGEEDFCAMGFDEYLGSTGSVCLIEWAEKVSGVLPLSAVQILLFRSGEAAGEGCLREAGGEDADGGDTDGGDMDGGELRQERRLLFYFPPGDGRAGRLRGLLEGAGFPPEETRERPEDTAPRSGRNEWKTGG